MPQPIECNKCGKTQDHCQCEWEPGMNCLGCGQITRHHYCENPACRHYEGKPPAMPTGNNELIDLMREEIVQHTQATFDAFNPTEEEFLEAFSRAYAYWQMRFENNETPGNA